MNILVGHYPNNIGECKIDLIVKKNNLKSNYLYFDYQEKMEFLKQ